jgi:glycine cleavage system protein P-like pyridoxal-binding family
LHDEAQRHGRDAAITWPEFTEIHPFAPADQALGYAEIIEDLSNKLCQITGYAVMLVLLC